MRINTDSNCAAMWVCIYAPDGSRWPDAQQRMLAKLAELMPGVQIAHCVTGPHSVEVTVNGNRHTLAFGYVPDGGPTENFDGRGGLTYRSGDGLPLGWWRWWEPGEPGELATDEEFVAYFAARAVPYDHGFIEWDGPKPILKPVEQEQEDRTPWQKGDDRP